MCEKGNHLFPLHNCSDSSRTTHNRGLATILHTRESSGDCIPLLQYNYCIVTTSCHTCNNMPAPFQDGGASKAARNRRPLPALSSSSGEELGLVPSKYLKRFYSDDATADDNSSTNNHSISSSTIMSTPPRKPKLHQHDPMSPSPQQQQVLKDIEMDELPLRTPQERLVLQGELERALMQKGAAAVTHMIKSSFVEEWKNACLRAEGYDVGRATVRIMHQWRLKSELFGTPDLKVTMGDVAPNLVHAGLIQLVPTRDLAGRCVVCMKFDPNVYSSQEREVRLVWSLRPLYIALCLGHACNLTSTVALDSIPLIHCHVGSGPKSCIVVCRLKSIFSTCWPVPWRMKKPKTRGLFYWFGICNAFPPPPHPTFLLGPHHPGVDSLIPFGICGNPSKPRFALHDFIMSQSAMMA